MGWIIMNSDDMSGVNGEGTDGIVVAGESGGGPRALEVPPMTGPEPVAGTEWAPEGVDLSVPSPARMYDYYLGGAHNFGVDRELAAQVIRVMPDVPKIAQANRAFLHRAVRFLLGAGVRQFIDIGSGIPTEGNTHETAQQQVPGSRVLYVDHDAVAVAHSEQILGANPGAGVLRADLRRPEEILDSPELGGLLDLAQPVGVLMLAVLPFISEDERPEELIGQFRERVAPGSYLVISHGTGEVRPAQASAAASLYRSAADKATLRSRSRVRELFDGWDLVEPGVVWLPQWHPDWPDDVGPDPAAISVAAGVGRRGRTS